MSKQLGHFVDKRILSGCQHDRNLTTARAAIINARNSEYGVAITRQEGLRRLSDADQIRSLRTHNVMSPDQIAMRVLSGTGAGPIVVEVSAGEFMDETMYGITVYHISPGDRERDWEASKSVNTLDELLAALRTLNGEG